MISNTYTYIYVYIYNFILGKVAAFKCKNIDMKVTFS
jgi:hypothetical protein